MFSNHINPQEDNDFIREFPIPDEDLDSEDWVQFDKDDKIYCCDCEYYNNNPIFPCAVNPTKVHQASDCQDYQKSKE